jgi:hypothetical protein
MRTGEVRAGGSSTMLAARPFPRKENLYEEKKEDKNKSHKVRLFLRLKEISFTTNIYYLALPGHRLKRSRVVRLR